MGLNRRHQQIALEDESTREDSLPTVLDNYAIIGGWSCPIVRLDHVELNREARFIAASEIPSTSDSDASDARAKFHVGFRWDAADDAVRYWRPQGITGTADTHWSGDPLMVAPSDNGTVLGLKLLIVSWYYLPDEYPDPDENGPAPPHRGMRISVVDTTRWVEPVRYRHILLVRPAVTASGEPSFQTIPGHAGGIAWFDRWLYVADGARLLVFDLAHIREVDPTCTDSVGFVSTGRYGALGYGYVVPLVRTWLVVDVDGAATFRFSCVSVDRSESPPRLAGARYIWTPGTDRDAEDLDPENALMAWWELDTATGGLTEVRGQAGSVQVVHTGGRNVQGALSVGDKVWLSRSSTNNVLWKGNVHGGAGQEWEWGHGCEDLHWSQFSDNLWSLTEFFDRRVVFAVKLEAVGG